MVQTHARSATVSPSGVLKQYRTIAVLGASKNPEKDAYTVPEYMKAHGYKIIPVNPTADQILGEKVYSSLADIPLDLARQVEIVDVFRPSEEFPMVANQVVEMKNKYGKPFVFWGQLGLENEEAKQLLKAGGVEYVMNACLRVVHRAMTG
jgi:uncharacterized protein